MNVGFSARWLAVCIWAGCFALLSAARGDELASKLMSAWQQELEDPSRLNIALRFQESYIAPAGVDQTGTKSVKRLNDFWHFRSVERSPSGGWDLQVERISTDQILHIQQRNRSEDKNPLTFGGLFKRTSDPSQALTGIATGLFPVFGIWAHGSEASLPTLLAQERLQSQVTGDAVVVTSQTRFGNFAIHFPDSDTPSPTRITATLLKGHKSTLGVLGEANSPLQSQFEMVYDWHDIEYEQRAGKVVPVTWKSGFSGKSTEGVHFFTTLIYIEEIRPNAGLTRRDFRPELPIPEGAVVSVSDLPVECVWRNGRIEPRFPPDVAGSTSGLKFLGQPSYLLLIAVGCLLLGAAIYLAYRLRGA